VRRAEINSYRPTALELRDPEYEAKAMTTITRRHFVQYGLGAGAALGTALVVAAASPGEAGHKLMPYLEPLPLPGAGIVVATPTGSDQYSLRRDRLSGNYTRGCRRPHSGPTTTAPDWPGRLDLSGWRLSRRVGRRSGSNSHTICRLPTRIGFPSCRRLHRSR
jgi:hypothetical protein